ncbi:MAG: phosphate signaling complex protein PhoU [Candidatus Xiphinematobacter sp.]|nr:MAG: phosphate signaling complex protein PhoU [Candidatus Xiphinematobacter sp.]QQY10058.1 MAG: phosphate signaling complex protein PhoU [Candidatus Xiphinematobacter sp.]QQY10792.1 MAG: phosphate signaling complex protein PhoU [Candidatus Xiphinematobacter sp.]QQY11536.1 MAG: phosphate signaling complex protein PhoU [Candidatus Xiphinematobacter sp.]
MNARTSRRHILGTFEAAMTSLRTNVLMMASLTQRNLQNSLIGLIRREDQPCLTVLANDEEIDALEVQIDREGTETMMRFNPVASDMREVLATMKLSVHLERIADQAVGISRRVIRLNAAPLVPEVIATHEMFRHATSMFGDALQAFANRNIELALTLRSRDRELDDMNEEIAEQLSDAMMLRDVFRVRTYLNLIFIARYIERIGDHSTNIAEDTVFLISALDIRHRD